MKLPIYAGASILPKTATAAKAPTVEAILESFPDEEFIFFDGFEAAILGVCETFTKPPRVLYDYRKCVEILVERDGMDEEEAEEFMSFNVTGAWVGESTPAFLHVPFF